MSRAKQKEIAMRLLLRGFCFMACWLDVTPSQAQIHLDVPYGPPPLRSETVQQRLTPNSVWIAGSYAFNATSRDFVWVPGHYVIPPSPDVMWVPPRYRWHHRHVDCYVGHWQ